MPDEQETQSEIEQVANFAVETAKEQAKAKAKQVAAQVVTKAAQTAAQTAAKAIIANPYVAAGILVVLVLVFVFGAAFSQNDRSNSAAQCVMGEVEFCLCLQDTDNPDACEQEQVQNTNERLGV